MKRKKRAGIGAGMQRAFHLIGHRSPFECAKGPVSTVFHSKIVKIFPCPASLSHLLSICLPHQKKSNVVHAAYGSCRFRHVEHTPLIGCKPIYIPLFILFLVRASLSLSLVLPLAHSLSSPSPRPPHFIKVP